MCAHTSNEAAGNLRQLGGFLLARVEGADPRRYGFVSGWFVRLVYALTKRKVGSVVMPVQVTAHHPAILWGYGQMEQAQLSSHKVPEGLKALASVRVASRVGCPF
jgi:hypothetical protein